MSVHSLSRRKQRKYKACPSGTREEKIGKKMVGGNNDRAIVLYIKGTWKYGAIFKKKSVGIR